MKIIISILLLTISSATHAQQIFEKIFFNQHGTACAAEDSDGHFLISFPEDTTIIKCDSNLNQSGRKLTIFQLTFLKFWMMENWHVADTNLLIIFQLPI